MEGDGEKWSDDGHSSGRRMRQDLMHWNEEREKERSQWDTSASGLSKWKEKVPFTKTGKIQKA